jgi:transcriptional regulator with XRE-family HTH domain
VARYPPNPRLRQARIHAALSQDEFAERLGEFMRDQQHCNVSPSGNLIGMWERGEVRPGRHYRRGLAAFTGLTEAILGFAPAALAKADAQAREEDDTNRREMITSMMAAGAALSGFPLPRANAPDRVAPQHLAELRRLTEMYRTWVYAHGADRELQHGISQLLDRATALIGQASAPQLRRQLLDALADTAGLAAYACRDLGQHDWAQRYYLIAMQAAHAAGDHALAGHLVVRMAGHHIELAQPAEVLNYLNAAASHAGRRSIFTHGELSNQHAIAAWANAQSGLAQHVHYQTGIAEEEFARPEQRSGPGWQIRHVAEAELYSLTGAAYAELARHDPRQADESIRRLSIALNLRGAGGARNATLDNISLAEAHLADHDLGQALQTTSQAIRLANDSASRRVRKRLSELSSQLTPHRKNPDTADTLEQIRTLLSQEH